MRYGILVFGIAVCIGLSHGWLARTYDRVTSAALTDDARLAIDVRCRLKGERAAQECRTTLKKLFLSRALDPEKALRDHCESLKHARWGGSHAALPRSCAQRYGVSG